MPLQSEEHAEGPPLTRTQRADGIKRSKEENEQDVGMDSEEKGSRRCHSGF